MAKYYNRKQAYKFEEIVNPYRIENKFDLLKTTYISSKQMRERQKEKEKYVARLKEMVKKVYAECNNIKLTKKYVLRKVNEKMTNYAIEKSLKDQAKNNMNIVIKDLKKKFEKERKEKEAKRNEPFRRVMEAFGGRFGGRRSSERPVGRKGGRDGR